MKRLLALTLAVTLAVTLADAQKIQFRRMSEAAKDTLTSHTVLAGEGVFCTDSKKLYVWGTDSAFHLIGPDTVDVLTDTLDVPALRNPAGTLAIADSVDISGSLTVGSLVNEADTSLQQIVSVFPQGENFVTTSSAWMPTAYDLVYAPFTVVNAIRPDTATLYVTGTLASGDSILVGIYSVNDATATRVAYSGWTNMNIAAPVRISVALTTVAIVPGQYILAYSHNTATAPTVLCGFYDGSTYTAFIKNLFTNGGGVRYMGQVAYTGLAEMPATINLATAVAYSSTPGPPIFYLIEN